MAKYNVSIFDNDGDRLSQETAKRQRRNQAAGYRVNKENPILPKKRTKAQQKKEVSKVLDFEERRKTLPVPEGQTAEEVFNPGMRTQKIKLGQGAKTFRDGTTLSLSDIERLANEASARVDSPLNDLGLETMNQEEKEIALQNYYDVEGSKMAAVPGLDNIDNQQTEQEMQFNRGLNRQSAPNFDPMKEQNNLVTMLATPKGGLESLANTVPQVYLRSDLDAISYKDKFDTIQEGSTRFLNRFDSLLAQDNANMSALDTQALTSMLANNNVSSRSLTELLYNKIAPAAELMRGNSPKGLSGAMYLAALQHYADAQVAADRRIEFLDIYPQDQKDLDSWSMDDREAFQNLSNEIYNEEMAGQKSIGYMVAQAGNMQLSGPEMSLLTEITKKIMIDEFGDEMFITTNTPMGERVMLTKNMARWVNEDTNMMMYLLNLPIKLPRVGEAGRIPLEEGQLDHRAKGIVNQMTPWLENKDISTELNEKLHKLALHVLNDTPHMTLNTQSVFHAMAMGYNSQTQEFTNNATSELYDSRKYKNIKYKGEQGKRIKNVEKYDLATDSVKEIWDSSDTEKDNLTQLNLKSAVQYVGQQIRFNHFVGSNFRFYHEASVLNPNDHSARAFLGAGTYIKYRTNSAKEMMLLKAGIMTMVDEKVPNSQVKYEQTRFQDRADAFDARILGWMNRFGDLVEAFESLDDPKTPVSREVEMVRALKDPSSPLAQATKELLEIGQQHNGYYTTNAIIEAVKLQLAIEQGQKVYNSNYMFEVDGTSNGLSLNALAIAEMKVLAMTGITPFILDQTTGYSYPDQYDADGNLITNTNALNMLTAPKPYEKLTQLVVQFLDNASAPAKRRLLDIAVKNGVVSDKSSKTQVTKGSYGSGEDAAYDTVLELYTETLAKDEFSNMEEELFDAGYGSREEIITDLTLVNWRALIKITGDLRNYGETQAKFLKNIVAQYTASLKTKNPLPAPATVLDSGYIMRHGEPIQTLHGPELVLPSGLVGSRTPIFRQNQNMIDPEGAKRSKKTGKPMPFLSATTGGPVKLTHQVDAYMVMQQALRAWAENPGAADGVMGGVLMQMYDGFFGAPMYAPWMDKTLNEEFLNLGYKVNNVSALINSAKAQGYNMNYNGLGQIVSELTGYETKGRSFLKNLTKQGITGNQFQIGDGARAIDRTLNPDGTIKSLIFFDQEERLMPRGSSEAVHKSTKLNPALRRTYKPPKGDTKEEQLEDEKEKKQRIRDVQAGIRFDGGRNRKAMLKEGTSVIVTKLLKSKTVKEVSETYGTEYEREVTYSEDTMPVNGKITHLNYNERSTFVSYTVLMDDGSIEKVPEKGIRRGYASEFDLPF